MLAVSRFVLRHKLAVAVFWLVVLAAGGAASAKLSGRLSGQFALPGAAGYQASQQILRIYGNGGPGYPEVAMVTLPPASPRAAPPGGRRWSGRSRLPPGCRACGSPTTPAPLTRHSSPATRGSATGWSSPPTPGS